MSPLSLAGHRHCHASVVAFPPHFWGKPVVLKQGFAHRTKERSLLNGHLRRARFLTAQQWGRQRWNKKPKEPLDGCDEIHQCNSVKQDSSELDCPATRIITASTAWFFTCLTLTSSLQQSHHRDDHPWADILKTKIWPWPFLLMTLFTILP